MPEEINGDLVTWNLFTVIGAQPSVGRTFDETDSRTGAPRTVILSDAFWRTRFASDPAILGQTIRLSQEPYVVVGVMPRDFQPPSHLSGGPTADFFVPAREAVNLDALRGEHELEAIGRLRPGVSLIQARDELRRIDEHLARAYPGTNTDFQANVGPLAADVTRRVRFTLLVVLATVGLVLLIASLNVANLLIVRAFGQRQDVAIRVALGASRADIVMDHVVRGLTLSALGGVAGLAVAHWMRAAFISAAPATIPRLDGVALNPRILAAAALLSLVTGVVAGLVPALQVARARGAGGLTVSESAGSGTPSVRRWQGALMACEVAAAVVIAMGAGLLVRSLILLNAVDLGFQTGRVLTFRARSVDPQYADAPARLAFFEEIAARVAQIPGVQTVAFATAFPLRGGWGGGLLVDGPSGAMAAEADFQAVSASYFSTLGIPLLRGRLLSETDRASAPPWSSSARPSPRSSRRGAIRSAFDPARQASPALTIVGVVGDPARREVRRDDAPGLLLGVPNRHLFLAARRRGRPQRDRRSALAASRNPARPRCGRSGDARVARAHARRGHRGVHGDPPLQHAPADVVRRARAHPGHGRRLRRGGARGPSAHARNRHPRGAGSHPDERDRAHRRRDVPLDDPRPGHRPADGVGLVASDGDDALRDHAERSDHLRRGDGTAARHRDARELFPRSPSGLRGSAARFALAVEFAVGSSRLAVWFAVSEFTVRLRSEFAAA